LLDGVSPAMLLFNALLVLVFEVQFHVTTKIMIKIIKIDFVRHCYLRFFILSENLLIVFWFASV
jgi:hypothetical protein